MQFIVHSLVISDNFPLVKVEPLSLLILHNGVCYAGRPETCLPTNEISPSSQLSQPGGWNSITWSPPPMISSGNMTGFLLKHLLYFWLVTDWEQESIQNYTSINELFSFNMRGCQLPIQNQQIQLYNLTCVKPR